MAEAGALFPIRKTIMWAQRGDWPFYGATYSASNPPRATPIRYYLREAPGGEDGGGASSDQGSPAGRGGSPDFELTITDASGETVRVLEGPAEAGINEVLWNWRYDAPYEAQQGPGGGGGFRGGAAQGPIVLPGTYTVSMEVGGETFTSTMEIEADPRRPMRLADRLARQDALMSLHELAAPLYEATQAARRLNGQLSEAEALLEDFEGATESLTEELAAIQETLSEITSELGQASGNARVGGAIQQSSTLPTEDQLWQVDAAWDAVPGLISRLNELITDRIPAFNSALNAEGVRPDPGEAVAVPRRGGG